MSRRLPFLRPLLLPVLLVAAVALARHLGFAERMSGMQVWARSLGARAMVVFVAAHILRAVCFVPSSLFCMVAGAAFGFWRGLLASYLGLLAGATVGYALSRFCLGGAVRRLARGRAGHILAVASSQGLLGMTLARAFSMVPFDLFNYTAGAVRVGFAGFLGGTALGLWPAMAFYVFLGSTLGPGAESSRAGFVLVPVMLLGAAFFWRAAAQRFAESLSRVE